LFVVLKIKRSLLTFVLYFFIRKYKERLFFEEKMSRITIVHLKEKFFEEHAPHAEILKKPG